MKIAFFIGGMGSGGAERVISILANSFIKLGWNVDIVLLLRNEVIYDLEKSINLVDFTGKYKEYAKNIVVWIKKIRNYIKQEKPTCIISFVGRINALVLTASMGLETPIIVSERNDPQHDGRSKLMLYYCNLTYKLAAAIIFQTKYEKKCFSRHHENRSYIIPNPVIVSKPKDCMPHYMLISTAGRLVKQKNHKCLIKAIAYLRKKYPNIKCIIYGDGELRDSLLDEIRNLGLSNNVELPGNVSDINRKISESGIFVLSSDYEGLSNALIEAMMLGKACISTNYPGANEIIQNEVNGLLTPCNDPIQMSKCIERLIENRNGIRERLCKKALEDSEKYSLDSVIRKWINVIEGITE